MFVQHQGRTIVAALQSDLQNSGGWWNHKILLCHKGFLVHLSMTVKFIVPFLKGLHLVTDYWWPKQDYGGWKMTERQWEAFLFQELDTGAIAAEEFLAQLSGSDDHHHDEPPVRAKLTGQVLARVEAGLATLTDIFEQADPPQIWVRVRKLVANYYGFEDASGLGFGDSFLMANGIDYCVGVWGSDEEGDSSNCKELKNCVGAMRRQAESGALIGSALFFFTDNAVAELAIYKGSANSPKLHALLVELRLLQAKYGFRLIVCHCAGTRMIAQGTDGVSRGQLDEGVMNGTDMMSIIPLHLNAMKRSRDVEAWIKTWLGKEAWIKTWLGKDAETLEPKDWFLEGPQLCRRHGWSRCFLAPQA
jgi:hypothetical protein